MVSKDGLNIPRKTGGLRHALGQAKLAWRLFRDRSVPVWTKVIPVAALLYVVLPGDLVPDVLPGLGQLDDATVLLLALKMFIDLCPVEMVRRYAVGTSEIDVSSRFVDASSNTRDSQLPSQFPGDGKPS